MRPDDKDYTLYYAHLSQQIAHDGQAVKTGDTLGLVGNTGNAAGGPTHLHFGIYTYGGAIDPLPFVDREVKQPRPVIANTDLLNSTVRVKAKSTGIRIEPGERAYSRLTLTENTILTAEAATDGWFKVSTPDGKTGFVHGRDLEAISPIRTAILQSAIFLLDAPDTTIAARKKSVAAGNKITVLGNYKNYELVKYGDITGWMAL